MVARVNDLPGVVVVDNEPHRELHHSTKYTMRIKRHSPGDRIRTYPTTGALKFWSSEMSLPGRENVSLAVGYLWDADERAIGHAIMSYRDALDHPVWAVTLSPGAGGASSITWRPVAPSLLEFDLGQIVAGEADAEGHPA